MNKCFCLFALFGFVGLVSETRPVSHSTGFVETNWTVRRSGPFSHAAQPKAPVAFSLSCSKGSWGDVDVSNLLSILSKEVVNGGNWVRLEVSMRRTDAQTTAHVDRAFSYRENRKSVLFGILGDDITYAVLPSGETVLQRPIHSAPQGFPKGRTKLER